MISWPAELVSVWDRPEKSEFHLTESILFAALEELAKGDDEMAYFIHEYDWDKWSSVPIAWTKERFLREILRIIATFLPRLERFQLVVDE